MAGFARALQSNGPMGSEPEPRESSWLSFLSDYKWYIAGAVGLVGFAAWLYQGYEPSSASKKKQKKKKKTKMAVSNDGSEAKDANSESAVSESELKEMIEAFTTRIERVEAQGGMIMLHQDDRKLYDAIVSCASRRFDDETSVGIGTVFVTLLHLMFQSTPSKQKRKEMIGKAEEDMKKAVKLVSNIKSKDPQVAATANAIHLALLMKAGDIEGYSSAAVRQCGNLQTDFNELLSQNPERAWGSYHFTRLLDLYMSLGHWGKLITLCSHIPGEQLKTIHEMAIQHGAPSFVVVKQTATDELKNGDAQLGDIEFGIYEVQKIKYRRDHLDVIDPSYSDFQKQMLRKQFAEEWTTQSVEEGEMFIHRAGAVSLSKSFIRFPTEIREGVMLPLAGAARKNDFQLGCFKDFDRAKVKHIQKIACSRSGDDPNKWTGSYTFVEKNLESGETKLELSLEIELVMGDLENELLHPGLSKLQQ